MNTIRNIKSLENTIRKVVSETKADGIRQEIDAAYDAVKAVKKKLRELGHTNGQTKVLKAAARKMVDELEDLEDMDAEEEMTETDHETVKKNEQSEGYGSWQGLGMSENVSNISESQLNRLIESSLRKKKLLKEVRKTYKLISRRIIKEGIGGLKLTDYEILLNEQGQYDRNPGIAAAEGIENILDSLQKAWSMIRDTTTRKQISNTLTKLNNFATYTAELIGSGSSQRNPRSFAQVSKPLPYPELDEPEELEDIDDGLEDFDEWMDDLSDRNGTTDY
jgi:hypothetical protein